MLARGGFTSQFLPSPPKICESQLSPILIRWRHQQSHRFSGQMRTGFCVSALKSRREGGISFLEMGGFDGEEEWKEDGGDSVEDDEVFIPLRNMKDWLENKPHGFGEGKVYDTSIEDKLLDEMEQSRQAQLANINKLKSESDTPNAKKAAQKPKAKEVVSTGVRVLVVNLPKKKNIHKDLQLAFKGVPGILNMAPAVSGNKKTRDPICKGFALVDLKSEADANRFVQMFSKQSIAFGKIQKQIRCDIIDSNSPNSDYEQLVDGSGNALQPSSSEGDIGVNFDIDDPSFDSWEGISHDKSDGSADEHVAVEWVEINEDWEAFDLSENNNRDEDTKPRTQPATISIPSASQEKICANLKKCVAKRKSEKVPKLNIPGSANRLKIKEKAVLAGVFSKYGAQAVAASKKELV